MRWLGRGEIYITHRELRNLRISILIVWPDIPLRCSCRATACVIVAWLTSRYPPVDHQPAREPSLTKAYHFKTVASCWVRNRPQSRGRHEQSTWWEQGKSMPMVTEMHRLQKFSSTGKLTDSHVGNRIRRDYKYLPIKGESMHVCGPGATCSHLELSFLTWSSSPWMFKLFVTHSHNSIYWVHATCSTLFQVLLGTVAECICQKWPHNTLHPMWPTQLK